jgi:hypothetical protein
MHPDRLWSRIVQALAHMQQIKLRTYLENKKKKKGVGLVSAAGLWSFSQHHRK